MQICSNILAGHVSYKVNMKTRYILLSLFAVPTIVFAGQDIVSSNPPPVVFGPPRVLVAGHGEVGQFILQTAIQFGGTPITTNSLPHISDKWSYADDPGGIVINLTHQDLTAVDSFLHQAFGQPVWRHDGQSAYYQLTTNACSISFMDEHDATYVVISRPHSNK